jgi:FHS family L-fucose permease-like MFS transporter
MGAISDAFSGPKYGFILATGFAGLLLVGLLFNWIFNMASRGKAESNGAMLGLDE